jgi:hypothetical protein
VFTIIETESKEVIVSFKRIENAYKFHYLVHQNNDFYTIIENNDTNLNLQTNDNQFNDIPDIFYCVEAEGALEFTDDEDKANNLMNKHAHENFGDWEGYVAELILLRPEDDQGNWLQDEISYLGGYRRWCSDTVDGRKYRKKFPDVEY